jgi:membrane protein required for colicin V production
MNWIDWAIVGTFGLLIFVGFKGGILAPASGLGGVILGVALAYKFHSYLAGTLSVLSMLIKGDAVRSVVAFVVIVACTTVVARVTARAAKGLLSTLMLGWLDRVAGGLAGAGIAMVIVGTGLYMLGSIGLPPLTEYIEASTLAPQVSQISLISDSIPDCQEGDDNVEVSSYGPGDDPGDLATEECANFATKAKGLLGDKLAEKMEEILGEGAGPLGGMLEGDLAGGMEGFAELLPQVQESE